MTGFKMMQKPKSAPPRMTSKFASSRTNARKEIEAWVKKDADPLTGNFESLRMSGQLTDNITEERMLKAKLLELSKERYKFLTQNNYEKKVFIDRMMRKSSAIRRVMSATQNGEVLPSKKRANNARFSFLDRMDPTKNKKNSGLPPKPTEVETKPKEKEEKGKKYVKFISTFSKDESSSGTESEVEPVHISPCRFASQHVRTLPKTLESVVRDAVEEKILDEKKPWLSRGARSSIRRKGTTTSAFITDPRYANLHHRLCPVTKRTSNVDIHSVVNKIESLHVQPKVPKDGKPKVEMKAVEFMKKRGFVFP